MLALTCRRKEEGKRTENLKGGKGSGTLVVAKKRKTEGLDHTHTTTKEKEKGGLNWTFKVLSAYMFQHLRGGCFM